MVGAAGKILRFERPKMYEMDCQICGMGSSIECITVGRHGLIGNKCPQIEDYISLQ